MYSVSASSDERASILAAATDLRSTIRDLQEEIEREGRVPEHLLGQLQEAGLYRMVVPRALGGAQVDLLTFHRAIEIVSEGDGSVGWNIVTSSVMALNALSLPDEGLEEVYGSGPDVRIAGTIAPGGGTAVPVDGGYVVSGRWPFGSGCQGSEWMMGSFTIVDADEPRRNPDGSPAHWRGLFHTSECTIIETWDVNGLRGTGSHDWAVADVFIPARRTAPFPPGATRAAFPNQWRRWDGTLYQIPRSGILGGTPFTAVATGIARAAIDTLGELAGAKIPMTQHAQLREQSQVQEWVGRAESLLGAARAYRAATATEVWEMVERHETVTMEQLARCRLAAVFATDAAIQAVDLMYRAGGTTSLRRAHRLSRCWRDVHAVGQNFALLPEYYVLAGRALLGLDPGPKLAS